MTYITPFAILPKFLWRHIVGYLSYTNITKLIAVNSHFVELDNGEDKSSFLEDHKYAIAVVKCQSNRMAFFWKYATETYVECYTIDKLFLYLKNSIGSNTTDAFVYYKIFIKPGKYSIHDSFHRLNCVFNTRPCSIEINGSKSKQTSIKYDITGITGSRVIIISKYFSMKYISFYDMPFFFKKRRYDNDNRCDEEFIAINGYSELYISNCTFEGQQSNLGMSCINKSTITNCHFNDHGVYISDYAFDSIMEKMDKLGLSIDIEYNISYCTFSLSSTNCVGFNVRCVSPRIIFFNNNIVLKAASLFNHQRNEKTVFLIKNNKISNVEVCMKYCSNFKFEDNHFDNVTLLHDDACDNITVDDTNTFENCGEQLMAQLKIENVMQ